MAKTKSNGTTRHSTRTFAWIVIGFIALLIIAGYILAPQGRVSGLEFDPATAKQRSFSYWRIPFTNIGVTPVYREESRPAWASFLVNQGYWKVTSSSRWDLVYIHDRAGLRYRPSDPAVLLESLGARDRHGALVWETWSGEHPKTAKLLWPRVAELSRQGLYPYVTVLLEAALHYPEPRSFDLESRTELLPLLKNDLAQARESENRDRAVRLARFALTLWPNSQPWQAVVDEAE